MIASVTELASAYVGNGFLSVPWNSLRGIANGTNAVVVMPNATHVQIDRSSRPEPETCYNKSGISHQEPCGQLFLAR